MSNENSTDDDDGVLPPADQLPPDDRPSAAISERVLSLVNIAMYTVDLQCRRLRSDEPEDEKFLFRRWTDFEFLIVALRRMRRAADLGLRGIPETAAPIKEAIAAFDAALPGLATMRNVSEHIDDYILETDRRRHKDVRRGQLAVGSVGPFTFEWLDRQLNTDDAQKTAAKLYLAVRGAIKTAIREWRIKQWRGANQ